MVSCRASADSLSLISLRMASLTRATLALATLEVEPSSPEQQQLFSLTLRLGVALAQQPLDYAKTLIQLGHEPLPATRTRTFFTGRPVLKLPNVFAYAAHIRQREGFRGLYVGVAPKLINVVVGHAVHNALADFWPEPENIADVDKSKNKEEEEEKELMRELECVRRECCLRAAVVVATHPLHVVAVRAMAQFVGRETKYDGIVTAISTSVNQGGILGLWEGCFPRLLAETLMIGLSHMLTYAINKYVVEQKEVQNFTHHIADFVASSIVYPLHLASNCIIVSRSGLAAGLPPNMPLYQGWRDCLRHLRSQNALKRGSSLLLRHFTGPQIVVGDRVIPINQGSIKIAD